MRRITFPLPPLPAQHRIAAILSAYDDLIENNTRRIAILEEMARRIYEEWFVRFRFPGHEKVRMVESELGLVPEGWQSGTLADILENVRQATRPGEHLASRRYVPIDCIAKRSLVLPETRPIEEAQSSLVLFERDDANNLFCPAPKTAEHAFVCHNGNVFRCCCCLRFRAHAGSHDSICGVGWVVIKLQDRHPS
jgi:type I restriction enzyme S subunit